MGSFISVLMFLFHNLLAQIQNKSSTILGVQHSSFLNIIWKMKYESFITEC